MLLTRLLRRRSTVVGTLGLALLLGGAASVQAQTYVATTVMTGLFNPRGLTVTADGSIYVAESGIGGSGTQIIGPERDLVGYGNTGGVSRLSGGVQSRFELVDVNGFRSLGLPSLAGAGGGGATGLSDIIQGSDGFFYGVIGLGANPARRGDFTQPGEFGNGFGRLVRFDFSGTTPTVEYLADLAANELTNPDGDNVDSNPTGLIQTPTGFAVTDAGANVLLDVVGTSVVSTKTVFPAQGNAQAVPTAVAYGIGSQGSPSLFVSQLTGAPFAKGSANIYEVNPLTGASTIFADNFTTLIDVTYSNGFLYALELTTSGQIGNPQDLGNLWRINVATKQRDQLLGGFFFPGGVAVGPDETIYVSTGSVFPGGGSVLAVTVAAPEPGSIAFLLSAGAVVPLVRRRKRRAA